ncbi:MAG TPA: hypothetical protein VNF07_13725 [Acidimicrobiales bacterium]|nr:hypothetical protein [Acidimicrobiales bacterium]
MISTSGRNDAGRALCDVGATITTEWGAELVGLDNDPEALPALLLTNAFSNENRWTSPRSTHLLHSAGGPEHLSPIRFIRLQSRNLGRQLRTSAASLGRLDESRSNGLRTRQARGFKRPQRQDRSIVKPH